MPDSLDSQLQRWREAGLIEPALAARIQEFESRRPSARSQWPVTVALTLGGVMSAAGILLFVAANWQEFSPAIRMLLLVGVLAVLHLSAALIADRFAGLATTLHALGTVTLGAAVFLVGQAYHLDTAWPWGFLLWALGAWAGWFLIGGWPQHMLAAVLTPVWLAAQWLGAAGTGSGSVAVPVVGGLLLALVYLLADGRGHRSIGRTTLAIVGMLAVLPLSVVVAFGGANFRWRWDLGPTSVYSVLGWITALLGPLVLGLRLRRDLRWQFVVALLWVLGGLALGSNAGVAGFFWAAVGAAGLMFSGAVDASRRRINVGMTGFALTVVIFYFSSVLDRLGRATSLLAGGALFLLSGWALERVRRRLIARATTEVRP